MADIDISRAHNLDLEAAQQAADEIAADLASKFEIDYGWDGDTLVFERPGVRGRIDVTAELIRVQATLGLLLFYLRPAIEQEINRYLDQHFRC